MLQSAGEEKHLRGFQRDGQAKAGGLKKALAGRVEVQRRAAKVTAWEPWLCGFCVFIFSEAIKALYEDGLARMR